MQKDFQNNEKKIDYILKTSSRAKHVRLSVGCGGQVVLTLPVGVPSSRGEQFLHQKLEWVLKRIEYFKNIPCATALSAPHANYASGKEHARALVAERLAYFNLFYNFKFNRVAIRNQQTLWGSCTNKRNLNFNYKIAFLPPALADYVVVHELCHLDQMNHSQDFWTLVERTIPDARMLRRELKSCDLRS